jgi:hypothetical protein
MALNNSPMFIPVFADQKRVPAPAPLNFWLRPVDEALHQQSQETFVSDLRALADEWIKTGEDASGHGEEPGKRKLTRELRRIVNGWWSRNRPDVRADHSGEPVLSMPVFKRNFIADGVIVDEMRAAKEEAVRWFAWFLNFPQRYCLCKCRSCNEYYYTQRRPKGRIEYGTYCARHRHLASATRSYEARQAPAQARRLELAAQYWGKWPKNASGNEGKQAQWIARKVNDNVSPQWTPIRRNWVALHRAEIETRSRELQPRSAQIAGEQAEKGRIHAKG